MGKIDLIDLLSERERQQRDVAARVASLELVKFHTGLAEHYAKLLAEARALMPGRVPSIRVGVERRDKVAS